VELWLEMKLPNAEARGQILERHIGELPEELRKVEIAALVSATEKFTGADLKRLVEDGKAIYAYDKVHKIKPRKPTDYFLKAVEGVRENKERYMQAEAQAAIKPHMPMNAFAKNIARSFVMRMGGEE
jgi:transitional endoplasmic reticulum ATPase